MIASDVETMFHAEGWHQPPQLLSVHMRSEKEVGVADAKIDLPPRPGHVLKAIAGAMTSEHGDQLVTKLISDHIIGWVLVHQIMMNPKMDNHQLLTTDKDLADIPGSIEVRVVTGMDLLGRQFKAMRIRGHQPYDFTDHHVVQTGLIPEALHELCTAVATRMPDNQDFLTALSLVALPSSREVNAMAEQANGDPGFQFLLQRGDT